MCQFRKVLCCGSLAIALGVTTFAVAADETIDVIEVNGRYDVREFQLADTVDVSPDSAQLLRKAPGANVNANGPLTGIAQYRGMFGNRIGVQVNGMVLSAGGPNWMDPPLSYAPAATLESLVVYRGIAPVSAGQETIGGLIDAQTWSGDFSNSGGKLSGRVRAGYQVVNRSNLISAMLVAATSHHRVKVSAFTESGEDALFSGGDVVPTEFERHRYDLGYGFTRGDHLLQIDYGRNETGDSGTPALPMDIGYIDADLLSLRYTVDGSNVRLSTKFYVNDIDHGMTNYHLRQAPASGGRWRQNIATGKSAGFSVAAEFAGWNFGVDGHGEAHNSNISNPSNRMFFVVNFNDAERQVLGAYAERQFDVSEKLMLEVGVRYNNVSMRADVVNGTPATMMPPGAALRDAFNAADRSSTDNNIDWVTRAQYVASDSLTFYAGMSRKTRSPSYQERFLWLPLESTGGLADLRTYTGNLQLEPEVSHEVEFGFDTRNDRLTMSPRIFYRKVDDFIQGTVSTNTQAVMLVAMMNAMNGASTPPPLEFNNVEARLYGADLDLKYLISNHWSFSGVVSYVRGERADIDDNLYRISPLNALFALSYEFGNWGLTTEVHLNDAQEKVSATNGELTTPGYAVFNAAGFWQITEGLRLGFGVDNIANREFMNHLSGYNRVSGNPAIAVAERLPGYGRNVYARIDLQW